MNLKEIFIKSFGFLIFDWRFFAIVLAFYIFQYFLFDVSWSWTFNMSDSMKRFFIATFYSSLYFLFWVIFAPFVIYATREFFTKQQKIVFNIGLAKKHIVPLFTYQFIFVCLTIFTSYYPILYSFRVGGLLFEPIYLILGFLLLFTPVIIVLENEEFFMAVKKSIGTVRNNFKVCLIFYLILIFIDLISSPVIPERMWNAFPSEILYGLQLILEILYSIRFLIPIAALTGFYLSIIKEQQT